MWMTATTTQPVTRMYMARLLKAGNAAFDLFGLGLDLNPASVQLHGGL
jgi:hypothetical protein